MKRIISAHNARLLNVFALCHGAIFILPVLLPYYKNQIGIGFWELMAGEAVFSAVILICEIPTGWLADRWKRKYVLALAGVIDLMGWVLLLNAGSFLESAIAQGVIGVGVSMVSGTMSALHYDSLLQDRAESEYRKQEGRRHGFGLLSVGLSSLVGGFLYKLDPYLPLYVTMVSASGMVIAALMMQEPERHQMIVPVNPLVTMGRTLKYALHGHREVAEIIFSAAALFGTTKILMWAQQGYYAHVALDPQWIGLMLASGFFLGALASNIGHLLDHRFRNRTVLLAMMVTVVVICTISAALNSLAGAALLVTGSLFWGMGWPRVQDALNKRVESDRRAMVLSAASLMIHTVFIPLSLLMGWISDRYGIQVAVLCLGFVPFFGAGLLLRAVLGEWKRTNILIL